MDGTKAVCDAKRELPNGREAFLVLEGRASADESAMHSTTEDGDCVQKELPATSAKLQVAKIALHASFDYLQQPFIHL